MINIFTSKNLWNMFMMVNLHVNIGSRMGVMLLHGPTIKQFRDVYMRHQTCLSELYILCNVFESVMWKRCHMFKFCIFLNSYSCRWDHVYLHSRTLPRVFTNNTHGSSLDVLCYSLPSAVFTHSRQGWSMSGEAPPPKFQQTDLGDYLVNISQTDCLNHNSDVTMSAMSFKITSVSSVCAPVCSGADQRIPQSSASLAFVRGIHRSPVDSPHKGPVTRKMFPFDEVIMWTDNWSFIHKPT